MTVIEICLIFVILTKINWLVHPYKIIPCLYNHYKTPIYFWWYIRNMVFPVQFIVNTHPTKFSFFLFFFIANTKINKTIQIQHTQQRFDTMPTNKDLLHVQPNVCASNLLRQTTQYHIGVTFILPYSFHFNCDYPCEIHVIAFHTWRVISSHDDHHTYICLYTSWQLTRNGWADLLIFWDQGAEFQIVFVPHQGRFHTLSDASGFRHMPTMVAQLDMCRKNVLRSPLLHNMYMFALPSNPFSEAVYLWDRCYV